MAKGWGIHGWYMVELDEMPIEYIYIHTYQIWVMILMKC
jgi:hypothetical protein